MARIARVVVPGMPHHVTQRGNRRLRTFFNDDDYRAYLGLMAHWCAVYKVQIWAYCLMPNHSHLIAVPQSAEGLRQAIGEAHRRFSRRVNFRQRWRGHLWQGRFASFVMEEPYLLAAARYVELNPVRAKLVVAPGDFPWSSAAAHLRGEDDVLATVGPLLGLVPNWSAFLGTGLTEGEWSRLRRHETTGRPLGDDSFLGRLETLLGRVLRRLKPGPKPRKGK